MRAVAQRETLHTHIALKLLVVVTLLIVAAVPLHSQTLHGQVVDSVDNQPLSGLEVTLLDAQRDTVATTRSGADGRFAIPAPAGTYTLCVRCIGHRPKQLPVEVPNDEAVVVRLAPLSIPSSL
jgi:hypothetical protein